MSSCWGLVLLACAAPDASEPSESAAVRVMTFNVKGAQLATLERLAQVIEDGKPELVALQELFFDADWNAHTDQARELARLTGLVAHPLVTLAQAADVGPFGAEIAGQALLSRRAWPVAEALASAPGVAPFGGRVRTSRFDVVFVHLVTDAALRDEAIAWLRALPLSAPTLLLGDFNTTDIATLAETFTDSCGPCGGSFPADTPDRQIDFVLTSTGLRCTACETMAVTASDHRPLLANVELDP